MFHGEQKQQDTNNVSKLFELDLPASPVDGSPNHLMEDYNELLQWWNDCKSIDLDLMMNRNKLDEFFSSLKVLLVDDGDKDPYHKVLEEINIFGNEFTKNSKDKNIDYSKIEKEMLNKIVNMHMLQAINARASYRIREIFVTAFTLEFGSIDKLTDNKEHLKFIQRNVIKTFDLVLKHIAYELILLIRHHLNQPLYERLKYSEVMFIVDFTRKVFDDMAQYGMKMIISNAFESIIAKQKNEKFRVTFSKEYLENWM